MTISNPHLAFPEFDSVFRCPVCEVMIEHFSTHYRKNINGALGHTHIQECIYCHIRWVRFKEEGGEWSPFKLVGGVPSRVALLMEAS
jgi:hypothetical protein